VLKRAKTDVVALPWKILPVLMMNFLVACVKRFQKNLHKAKRLCKASLTLVETRARLYKAFTQKLAFASALA